MEKSKTQTPEPTVQELFDLQGKTSLVTGASGHLGGALARALAEAGSRVVVTSRDLERATTVAGNLPDPRGIEHLGMKLDQMEPQVALERAFADIVEKAHQIDVLVNNGHEHGSCDWTDVSGDQFTRQLGNASAYFLLARLLREHAVGRRAAASVIMLGSMYGQVGSYPDTYLGVSHASPVAYHTLKGGIIHMTRHLAVYWAKDNVRVNCLSPGPFPNSATAPQEMVSRLCQKSPTQRMGSPHELKGAIVFLASEASSYMTGQNLTVDGGWTAW